MPCRHLLALSHRARWGSPSPVVRPSTSWRVFGRWRWPPIIRRASQRWHRAPVAFVRRVTIPVRHGLVSAAVVRRRAVRITHSRCRASPSIKIKLLIVSWVWRTKRLGGWLNYSLFKQATSSIPWWRTTRWSVSVWNPHSPWTVVWDWTASANPSSAIGPRSSPTRTTSSTWAWSS